MAGGNDQGKSLRALWRGVEADRQQHSLRSLRKTILAFRTAAHMNEDDADQGSGLDTKYRIDSAQGMSPSKLSPLSLYYRPSLLSFTIATLCPFFFVT